MEEPRVGEGITGTVFCMVSESGERRGTRQLERPINHAAFKCTPRLDHARLLEGTDLRSGT